jgi:hypothetical protein
VIGMLKKILLGKWKHRITMYKAKDFPHERFLYFNTN